MVRGTNKRMSHVFVEKDFDKHIAPSEEFGKSHGNEPPQSFEECSIQGSLAQLGACFIAKQALSTPVVGSRSVRLPSPFRSLSKGPSKATDDGVIPI